MKQEMQNILKLVTGEVLDQYGLKKNVNNVVYVFLFAQKMQFLFVKIL